MKIKKVRLRKGGILKKIKGGGNTMPVNYITQIIWINCLKDKATQTDLREIEDHNKLITNEIIELQI